MYMMPFWQGYMNANSVGFVREAVEVVPTLHADTMELTDAVLQPRCADDSLCPRRGEPTSTRSLRWRRV